MPCRSVCRTALRALLAGPRFRPDLYGDTVFLGGTGRRSVNFLNDQKLCVLAFVSTDQCVSNTSVRPPIYTVSTPRRTVVRAGHDTVLLERGRGGGSVSGTAAGYARYCIGLLRVVRKTKSSVIPRLRLSGNSTVTGRFLVSCHGTAGTTRGLRTDIGRRSSWYRRRDCLHQCPERPCGRPVECPCIVRNSHGLRSSEGAISLAVPQV